MGQTWSVYISDEEKNERIEELAESRDYRNASHVLEKGVDMLLDEEFTDELV